MGQPIQEKDKERFWYLKTMIIPCLLAIIVFRVFLPIVLVQGSSMEPTYYQGDIVFMIKPFMGVEKGDVITFKKSNSEENRRLIKRVVAAEGDIVSMNAETGEITVNGEVIVTESDTCVIHEEYRAEFPVTVEKDTVFVLGDNHKNSKDSRYKEIGLVPMNDISGKKLFGLSVARFKNI